VDAGFFADAAFMAKLDVNFVNRFLAAVDAHRATPATRRARGESCSTGARTPVWRRCSSPWPG
jgi:hypothetical protein